MEDRTPIVTVELQLRPQPPKGSTPWFWGAGMLDFHVRRSVDVVWRAELPEIARMRCAKVEQRPAHGRVLVLHFTYDDAKRILSRAGLPECLGGWDAPVGLRPHASPCAST